MAVEKIKLNQRKENVLPYTNIKLFKQATRYSLRPNWKADKLKVTQIMLHWGKAQQLVPWKERNINCKVINWFQRNTFWRSPNQKKTKISQGFVSPTISFPKLFSLTFPTKPHSERKGHWDRGWFEELDPKYGNERWTQLHAFSLGSKKRQSQAQSGSKTWQRLQIIRQIYVNWVEVTNTDQTIIRRKTG